MEPRERPILFSGEMVRAILAGRKTQTRRVIKPRPFLDEAGHWHYGEVTDSWSTAPDWLIAKCPYGVKLDRLWVRETWQGITPDGKWWHEVKPEHRDLYNWAWTNPVEPAYDETPPRWVSGIHMPREVSRITLEVTGVRVELVQDISEADAAAEGVPPNWCGDDLTRWDPVEHGYLGVVTDDDGDSVEGYHRAAGEAYVELWDSINAKRGYGWDVNPWVWVVEFRVVKPGQTLTPAFSPREREQEVRGA